MFEKDTRVVESNIDIEIKEEVIREIEKSVSITAEKCSKDFKRNIKVKFTVEIN